MIGGPRGTALVAAASLLFVQERPSLEVRLNDEAPGVPALVVRLRDLTSDRRFVRAMQSGFPLYVEFHVDVRESRSSWFDRSVATHGWEFVVLHDPVRESFVAQETANTVELATERELASYLDRVYVIQQLAPQGDGTFYYRVTVTARTLSDADVDEVFDWLKGQSTDSSALRSRGLLTRTARRLLVSVAPLPRMTISENSPKFTFR